MSKRSQPTWKPPQNGRTIQGLRLFNSLTRKKEEFVPQFKNRILWYSCGPTVYDASHMGHARSYISFDILRRVLGDYFDFDITYVMNITDIDDKIIKRARQNHLYDNYVKENHNFQKILQDAKDVLKIFKITIENTNDEDKKKMFQKMLALIEKSVDNLEAAVKLKNESLIQESVKTLLNESKDSLSDWLDKQRGEYVTDHAIFNNLSQYWENDYHTDMSALNVLRPNVLTRVSEYVPEIIAFIEKIIENGFAYESNNSIYFDVKAFDKNEGHFYAKLVPEAYGDTSSLQEGEGDLSISVERLSEKRSPTDFALWKTSKGGEPWWDSPWGRGRPGWHIECSVMASAICGSSLDIHTGGVDLKFPHHDNELAQAEAYYSNSHWVRYFLHSGHLTISGCKMSKSLKNFITIKEALRTHTATQLRLAFLFHAWNSTLDYGEATMKMAMQYEKFLNEFFLNVKCKIRKSVRNKAKVADEKHGEMECDLENKYKDALTNINNALCDNIDTRTTLDTIRNLVVQCNVYIKESKIINIQLLQTIAEYITNILTIFGVIPDHNPFLNKQISQKLNPEEVIKPYLEVISDFREKVKLLANSSDAQEILNEIEKLRPEVLSEISVYSEIKNDSAISVKLPQSVDGKHLVQYENILNEFLQKVVSMIKKISQSGSEINTFEKWGNKEFDLNKKFEAAQDSIYDYQEDLEMSLKVIIDLVADCDYYMKNRKNPNSQLIADIATYIQKKLKKFGAIPIEKSIGFPVEHEELIIPYLERLSYVREKVRVHARNLKATNILKECDKLRDEVLPNLGVRFEDEDGDEPASVKLYNREELLKEIELKKKQEMDKVAEKEKKKTEAAALAAAKEAQKKIPPTQMFKLEVDKYSKFDENGLPTHDKEGKEISKGQMKKLQKLQKAQEKIHNEYLISLKNGT